VEVSLIGGGRVGTALGVLLSRAGHRIVAIAGREETRERAARFLSGVPLFPVEEAAALGDIVLIAVPDDRISEVCERVAPAMETGRSVAHVSGSVGLAALDAAAGSGARVLSVHPLQTCPSVEAALERIPGCAIAVTARDDEGFALGERLAIDAGGRPFRLDDEMKPLYHAAAVFASNYFVAVTAMATDLLRAAGVDESLAKLLPLSRATLDNVEMMGPEAALTGPAVRGDAGTVTRNLEALAAAAPQAIPAYVALARAALEIGARSGRISPEDRASVEEALASWT
jgi:predicted short-subunit dehydrogenase-like oxidoreductase (DUF2520 family)